MWRNIVENNFGRVFNGSIMALRNSRIFNLFKYFSSYKTLLIVTVSLTNLLVNKIFSEVCFTNESRDSYDAVWKNDTFYNYSSNLCKTRYNVEDHGRGEGKWEPLLTPESLTCLRYWKDRLCTNSTTPSNCFPISTELSFILNDSSRMFPNLDSDKKFQVCFETLQVTLKEMYVCNLQRIKYHLFRTLPIVIHSVSFMVLVNTPDMRFSYGNSIRCYVTSLWAKSVLNVVVVSKVLIDYSYVCIMIGVALHFSWLLSQTWQIVISYRIWKGFKPEGLANARSLRAHLQQGYSMVQLSIVWGLPLLLTTWSFAMDYIPSVSDSVRPAFGVCRCWFVDERSRMMYAAVPAALAEVVALIMFLSTIYHLQTAKALSWSLQRSGSRRHYSKDTKWILIYIKVSFLTGASYILVTLTALYTLNYKAPQGLPLYIINTVKDIERLRGFEIFYIFVLNKKNFFKSTTSCHRSAENILMVELRVMNKSDYK